MESTVAAQTSKASTYLSDRAGSHEHFSGAAASRQQEMQRRQIQSKDCRVFQPRILVKGVGRLRRTRAAGIR